MSSCPLTGKKEGKETACVECISGTIHAGLPQGSIEPLHGLDTYIIGNRTNPRAIIVIYSDVFSHNLPNNKLIADSYAKSGEYLVYMPDFFEGDPLGLSLADVLIPADAAKQSVLSKYGGLLAGMPGYLMWLSRHGKDKSHKACVEWLQKLRRSDEVKGKKIGMVGMCWGGRFVLRASRSSESIQGADDKPVPLIDAGVALHPSNVVLPEDVEGLAVPVSIGWGEVDEVTPFKQKGQIEEIMKKRTEAGASPPEMENKVYTPGRHGFSVRGNPEDPAERKCLEDSVTQVLNWFEKQL
ncbi:alpha/beta-hydrolase [Karstenula rhodostoma CBS 690.94]|uniref:Alpha/beta-hydrolase n=1 Tax=Karstenula rhodostoma CBS 690.94 TaxID=1392251 RepID=A0A9P4U6Y4_9PLEO|nr:alpha/beta-hydrolase [Karstenula rhodostoma CBS 690.94]